MPFFPIKWRLGRWLYRPLPKSFRERGDQTAGWQELFSSGEMDKVEMLLRAICDAFCFSEPDRYHLAPTDTIAEVYRACYPRGRFWSLGDNMEVESLLQALEKDFRIDMSQLHPDLNLGDIAGRLCSLDAGANSPSKDLA